MQVTLLKSPTIVFFWGGAGAGGTFCILQKPTTTVIVNFDISATAMICSKLGLDATSLENRLESLFQHVSYVA